MLFSNSKNGSILAFFIIALSILTNLVNADVIAVLPMAGRKFTVSGSSVTITVGWIDNQDYPILSDDIDYYTLTLCSGPNSKIESIKALATKVDADDVTLDGIIYKYDVTVDSDIAASGVFFIQIYAAGSFGYTIHYTSRFTISGLTGSIVASSAGDVTTPPSAQYSINTGTTSAASINSASFSIPYPSQSGISKFAPMQTQPGTTVTKPTASWTRQFPTSAYTYYTTIAAGSLRDCTTTVTPGWSYYITSYINYQSGTTKTDSGYAASLLQSRTTKLLV